MDWASALAAAVAVAGAAYLAAGLLLDGVRWLTRARLPHLPSLRPLLAAVTMLAMLGRAGPAAATTPPPAHRLGGRAEATSTFDASGAGQEAASLPAGDAAPGRPYEVAPGDSLWSIASRALGLGVSDASVAGYWPAIYAANRHVVGPDPDLIHPGQVLDLPETP